MSRHLLALALASAAAFGLSSCVVPLATGDQNCVTYCNLLQGCGSAAAPAGDCNSWCTAFATEVEHAGCKSQFDDATACVAGDGTCAAASCGSAFQAFTDCTSAFCSANPSDAVCPNGG